MRRSPWFAVAGLGLLFVLSNGLASDEPKPPAEATAPTAQDGNGGKVGFFGIDSYGPFEIPERPRAKAVPAGDEEPASPEPDPVMTEVLRREDAARAAFRRAKIIDVEESFENVPLREVIEKLVGKLGMPVLVDETALRDAGVKLDELVTWSFKGVTLGEAFEELEDLYGITLIRDGRRVAVTTLEIAEETMETLFYPIGDLTITTRKDGKRYYDAEPLIGCVEETTSGPWYHIDGVGGTLAAYDAGALHLLAVRQTAQVQEEVEELLHRLRSMRVPAKTAE